MRHEFQLVVRADTDHPLTQYEKRVLVEEMQRRIRKSRILRAFGAEVVPLLFERQPDGTFEAAASRREG